MAGFTFMSGFKGLDGADRINREEKIAGLAEGLSGIPADVLPVSTVLSANAHQVCASILDAAFPQIFTGSFLARVGRRQDFVDGGSQGCFVGRINHQSGFPPDLFDDALGRLIKLISSLLMLTGCVIAGRCPLGPGCPLALIGLAADPAFQMFKRGECNRLFGKEDLPDRQHRSERCGRRPQKQSPGLPTGEVRRPNRVCLCQATGN